MAWGVTKAGSIDDPVWQRPAPVPSRRRTGPGFRRRRNRRLVLGATLVGVLSVTGVFLWSRWSHPGGDPGNGIYHRLHDDVVGAIPPDASEVRMGVDTTVRWVGGCSEIAGARSGWTTAYVTVQFVDTRQSRAAALGTIAGALERGGWVRHDVSPGPKQGKVPHWVLDVHQGQLASTFAFGTPNGWFISASWRPPGPVGQPCP
ncbi:MAG TPA: hypothetical protein VGG23_10695 [Acidimicrobiales bacterium]